VNSSVTWIRYLPSISINPSHLPSLLLCSPSHLLSLSLYNNDIGPQGAQEIAEALKVNSSVTWIRYLPSISINPSHLPSLLLCSPSHLLSLSLYNNDIGPQGAQQIAEALKVNSSVTVIM
jgi:Ran GTPase-activating protein (RanGAP) involved in mRNA processing and transport